VPDGSSSDGSKKKKRSGGAFGAIRDTLGNAADTVRDVTDPVTDTAREVSEGAGDAVSDVSETANEGSEPARDAADDQADTEITTDSQQSGDQPQRQRTQRQQTQSQQTQSQPRQRGGIRGSLSRTADSVGGFLSPVTDTARSVGRSAGGAADDLAGTTQQGTQPVERAATPEAQRVDDRTLVESPVDDSQFDPTTQQGVSRASLEGDRRREAVEWATDELGIPEDEVRFARDQDGDLLAYRDPDAAEEAYGESLEQKVADEMGLAAGLEVDYNPESNQVELTDTGRIQYELETQRRVAEDLENYGFRDLETDVDPGGRVSVSVQDDAVRRELVEQIQSENPDVDRDQIEISRDGNELTATVEPEGDDTADPMGVARSELSSLALEASGPGDVVDAAGNVGGAVVDDQLGDQLLVDPRETDSAGEYAGEVTTAYDEEVLTVDTPEEVVALATDPVKVDSENFDDPGAAAGDLAGYYSGKTGITRESVSDATQTVISPNAGTTGALGTAAVAGIATPEPTTTAGGLILGAGVVGAAAIRQSRDRDQRGELPVSDPTQATSELGVGETTTGVTEVPVSESNQAAEVSVPETPPTRDQGSEVDVPSQPQTTDPEVVQTSTQIQRQITEETDDPREVTEGDFIIVDQPTIERNRQQTIREDLERQQDLWDIDIDEPREFPTGGSAVVGYGETTSGETTDLLEEAQRSDVSQSQGQGAAVDSLVSAVLGQQSQTQQTTTTRQVSATSQRYDLTQEFEAFEELGEETTARFEYEYQTQRGRRKRRRFPSVEVDQRTGDAPESNSSEYDRLIENELASADEVLGR